MNELRIATGTSPGKLILIGEHAVVYGKPAIALPFPMVEVKSNVKKGEKELILVSPFYTGPMIETPARLKGLYVCVQETFKKLNKMKEPLQIEIESTIPIGRGLGSSAALAIAIVRSLFAFYKKTLPKQWLMELVHLAETYAHGNPSGIDMQAAIHDEPIWFEKDRVIEEIDIRTSIHLVVADSGRIGDTRTAVSSIKEKLEKYPLETNRYIEKLGNLTFNSKEALAKGDVAKLGILLTEAHTHLKELGVSDDGLDQLVQEALKLGALGAKLTGGGRGGCILALASSSKQAEEIAVGLKERANAEQTWHFTIYPTI